MTDSPVFTDTAATGTQLAAQGRDRAARAAGATFAREARAFFVAFAMGAKTPVTVAEARLASVGHVTTPGDGRAWGSVPLGAERAGLVVRAGFAPSPDPRSHAGPRTLWRAA